MRRLIGLAPILGRFLLVGLSGTVVNLAVLAGLVTVGLPTLLAAVIATEVSILTNFICNDLWTFRPKGDEGMARLSLRQRFGRFQVIAGLGAFLTIGLFGLLHNGVGLHYLVAQTLAIGLTTLVNFAANLRLTWRVGPVSARVSRPIQEEVAG